MINKRLINTGVAAAAPFDPLQNFETVTYTGNGGTQKITGYIRKGAAFANGYITTPFDRQNIVNLNDKTEDFSVSLWVNLAAYGSSNVIFSIDSGAPSYQYIGLVTYSAGIDWVHYPGGAAGNGVGSPVNLNEWNHFACVRENSTMKLYKNGSLVGSDPITYANTTFGTGERIVIGKRTSVGDLPLNGKVDQFRIFNKAISSSEVTTLYGETYASATKSTTDIFGDGSGVALYELDEDANDTGTGAIDSGQSAVFNGSSSYISTPVLSLANNSFTVSTWVNRNNLGYGLIFAQGNSSDNNPVISFGFGSTNQLELLNRSAPGVGLDVYISDSVHNVTSANTWYHLLWSCTSNQSNFYVNGVLKHSASFTANSPTYNTQYIGVRKRVSFEGYFNGKIDQVRIYSSASSSSDVTNLYNETNVPTANLLAHYKLDGDATDETTNYDGTATSITYSDPAEFPPYNGTPTNVNFLGMAFQPDLVWGKSRNQSYSHFLIDSVRGRNSSLVPNQTAGENPGSNSSSDLISFDYNGFTVGPTQQIYSNTNGDTYVAWCWKAGGTAVSNTDGTITSDVSANVDAGFSIVKWQSNGTVGATIGHGLSSPPEMIILKDTSNLRNWLVYHSGIGATGGIQLNLTVAAAADSQYWNNTSPTSSVFSVSTYSNESGSNNMISYCFHSVAGYQKVGSYTGNGGNQTISTSVDGDAGFEPRFLIIKCSSAGESYRNWIMFYKVGSSMKAVIANGSNVEGDETGNITFNANDFNINCGGCGEYNQSGQTYIYLAIA